MGHGEFTKVLLAPGTHEKAFELTQKAFYLADKYQVPVFILTDQYLMDSIKSCKKWSDVQEFRERFIDNRDDYQGSYQRYSFTEDGISPRKIPGMTEEAVVADSHTHDESGHISEDNEIREKSVEKLLMKKERILKDISPPYISTEIQKDNLLIGWGSTFGVISDAERILTEEGFSVSHIHYHEVYPLNLDYFTPAKPYKRIISIENNATGQFARLLQMEGLTVDEKILKYNGRPFYLDELLSEIKRRLQS
jgi:2-oxoglutarate ferredoxin oxidoreductase subunit alpha